MTDRPQRQLDRAQCFNEASQDCMPHCDGLPRIIEKPHRHETTDVPHWALWARPFQFTVVLPLFASIIRVYASQWAFIRPIAIFAMAIIVGITKRVLGLRFRCATYGNGQRGSCGQDQYAIGDPIRITCYGMPEELEPMRNIEATFFEPYRVQYLPYPYIVNDWFALGVTLIVLICFHDCSLVFSILAPSFVVTALLLTVHALSTYIVVAPGRLYLLRPTVLRKNGFRLLESISLRDSCIVCDFAIQKLTLRRCNNAAPGNAYGSVLSGEIVHEFDLKRFFGLHAFVRCVIRAAMCPVDAPVVSECCDLDDK